MTVNFEIDADMLDLNPGIELFGYFIADVELGVGGVKAILYGTILAKFASLELRKIYIPFGLAQNNWQGDLSSIVHGMYWVTPFL
jgi:hypothetical protein